MLPVYFVTCSGRVSVTFFLLEESDFSRLGTLPFPLVFGFHADMISAGMDLFCERWLWYVLCVVHNFSRLCLSCAIISYIDTSEVEK